MKKRPWTILALAIFILIVPTIIYLCFLIPQLKEEYNVLMVSGGIIGGTGLYGTSKIPEKVKYSGLFKTASTAFTLLTVTTLIEKFIAKIIGLVAVFVVSYIIFKILLEVWRSARRRKENSELATEIARNITEIIK